MPTPPKPLDHLPKKPRTATVGIYLDDDLATVWEQAVADLDAQTRLLDETRMRRIAEHAAVGDPDIDPAVVVEVEDVAALTPLREAVTAALAALDAGTVWFTFQSLGRRRFAALMAEHPPTDDDQAAAEQLGIPKASYNLEGLGPALVLASCIHPVLAPQLVTDIFEGDAWNETEIAMLVSAALDACTQARAVKHTTPPRP